MQFSCSISAKKYYFRKFPRTLRRMIVVLDREILDRRKYPLENKSKARAETSSAIKEILQQIIDDEREGEGGGGGNSVSNERKPICCWLSFRSNRKSKENERVSHQFRTTNRIHFQAC